MYDALLLCALAQDVRVGLSWRDTWDLGTPLLMATRGAGVATVSGGIGAWYCSRRQKGKAGNRHRRARKALNTK
jgi:hypothetical protein